MTSSFFVDSFTSLQLSVIFFPWLLPLPFASRRISAFNSWKLAGQSCSTFNANVWLAQLLLTLDAWSMIHSMFGSSSSFNHRVHTRCSRVVATRTYFDGASWTSTQHHEGWGMRAHAFLCLVLKRKCNNGWRYTPQGTSWKQILISEPFCPCSVALEKYFSNTYDSLLAAGFQGVHFHVGLHLLHPPKMASILWTSLRLSKKHYTINRSCCKRLSGRNAACSPICRSASFRRMVCGIPQRIMRTSTSYRFTSTAGG